MSDWDDLMVHPDTPPVITRSGPSARVRANRGFAAGLIAGVMLAALLAGWFIAASDAADPWHGVPVCTDQIADAGGVCHGEPR